MARMVWLRKNRQIGDKRIYCFSLEGRSCCPRTGPCASRLQLYHWSLAQRFPEPTHEQNPWSGIRPCSADAACSPCGSCRARAGRQEPPVTENAALHFRQGCREAPPPEGRTLRAEVLRRRTDPLLPRSPSGSPSPGPCPRTGEPPAPSAGPVWCHRRSPLLTRGRRCGPHSHQAGVSVWTAPLPHAGASM